MPAHPRRPAAVRPLIAALALAAGSFAAPGESPAPPRKETVAAVPTLAGYLLGTYRGTSPGNGLTVVSSRVGTTSGPASQLAKLKVVVTGTYEGDAVTLTGMWRVSYQGDGNLVWLVYVPGVDPLDASRRLNDPTFAPTELGAGCWAPLVWRGGVFEGSIKRMPDCRNAIRAGAIQSVDKDWTVRFAKDEMRFENRDTGEVLAFARAPDAHR